MTLYLFRRSCGTILLAMIARGVWDVSSFLSGGSTALWAAAVSFALVPIGVIIGIVAMVSIWRTDRNTVVTPAGVVRRGT